MVDVREDRFLPYARKGSDRGRGHPAPVSVKSNAIVQYLDPEELAEAREGAELILEASKPFDVQSFLEGAHDPGAVRLGPLRHFGVDQLLETLGAYAPPPRPVAAEKNGQPTHVAPGESEVTGFVFKVQANMDPNHRDSIAMLRLTSGRFQRGMKLKAPTPRKTLSELCRSIRRSCSWPPSASWPRRPSPAT